MITIDLPLEQTIMSIAHEKVRERLNEDLSKRAQKVKWAYDNKDFTQPENKTLAERTRAEEEHLKLVLEYMDSQDDFIQSLFKRITDLEHKHAEAYHSAAFWKVNFERETNNLSQLYEYIQRKQLNEKQAS